MPYAQQRVTMAMLGLQTEALWETTRALHLDRAHPASGLFLLWPEKVALPFPACSRGLIPVLGTCLNPAQEGESLSHDGQRLALQIMRWICNIIF